MKTWRDNSIAIPMNEINQYFESLHKEGLSPGDCKQIALDDIDDSCRVANAAINKMIGKL